MASPPTSVLLRMLEPWLLRARARMELSIDTFVETDMLASSPLWIQWSLPDDGALAVEDVEAMELLEQLVRVDRHAGWKTLLEITNNSVHLDRVMEAATLSCSPLLPQYKIIHLKHAYTHSTFETALRWLLFAVDPEEHSPAYYAVRQTLLQSCADRHHGGRIAPVAREANDRIRLKFDLDLTNLDPKDAEKMMKKLVEAAALTRHPERFELGTSWQHASGRSISTLSDAFSFCAVDVTFGSVLSSTSVLDLTQRLCDQLAVNVEVIDMKSAELPVEMMIPFFRSIFAQDATDKIPIQFELGYDVGFWQLIAASSTLQINQSIQKIRISLQNHGNEREFRCWWAWIAYAIFSAEASATIKTVCLVIEDLTLEDVLVFEQVLEMRDPLVYIASCLDGSFELRSPELSTQAPTVVEVLPRAPLLTGDERTEFFTKNEMETLRVVGDSPDKQHVRVVYPGAGICWVHRSHIIRHREFTVRSASADAVNSICLFIDESTELLAVKRLLKSIGRGIRRLELRVFELILENDFFSAVFAECPLLCRLDLVSAEVAGWRWLETCGSRLQSLSLGSVGSSSFRRLLSTINAGSGHLVDLHIQRTHNQAKALMFNIEQMLDRNSTIERMFLSVNGGKSDIQLVKTLTDRLSKHSGKTFGVQRMPLPLRSKIAFLSVVLRPQTASHVVQPVRNKVTEAGAELDAVLTAMIFAFAAPCKQRVCGFVPFVQAYDINEGYSESSDDSDNNDSSSSSDD